MISQVQKKQIDLPPNLRSFRLSAIGARKLGQWLIARIRGAQAEQSFSKMPLRILDYGCGYFDLGISLKDYPDFRVDGFEPDTLSAQCSKKRCEGSLPASRVFTDKKTIPIGIYDMVTVNSVLQYFEGNDDLKSFLTAARGYLNRNSPVAEIIITDVIPLKYSKVADLIFSLWDALWQGIIWDMLKHIFSILDQGTHQKYFQIDAEDLTRIALEYNFQTERLPLNLSPSRFRYTLKLKLTKDPLAGSTL